VRAHPESARRVLRRGGSLLVSAGGDLDACRAFGKKRDRVAVGDRAGFVRIARDAGVPIIPIVAQGTHRSALIVREAARLAEAVGLRTWSNLERVPIAREFARMPAASPRAPYRGVPFKVRLRVLPPIVVPRRADCDAMRALLVDRMQAALDELAAR
jgi:1-acyl-sn-glycerol-3-phosphate acyltransferase